MKRIITVLTVISLFTQVNKSFAQQSAMFSQYMFNTLAFNPAYAGSRNVVAATALYRNQWVGMDGAPKTATFTIDAPFAQERVGLGMQIISDKLGITTTTGFSLSGAYRIPLNTGTLAFGMEGSFSQYHAGYTDVVLDPSGPVSDPGFRDNVTKFLSNASAGAYYSSDRFYAGLSIKELIPNRLTNDSIPASGITARQSAHAFLATGYVFPLNDDFNLKTSVLLKGVKGAPVQADINGTVWIKDIFAVGAEYRSSADISFMAEIRMTSQVRIGYAYDKSTTALRNYNSGSHEFMIRYEFSFDRDKILSPRYF
jgi:type IX secretion system PorP/SprF family membrane protein